MVANFEHEFFRMADRAYKTEKPLKIWGRYGVLPRTLGQALFLP